MIVAVSATGPEIQKIITERLAPAVEGQDRSHVLISLLTFAVILSKPDITSEELYKTVKDVSSYILCLTGKDSTSDSSGKILLN